ncbi:hypothetical protein N7603_04190 [Acholeplasma vituli]|uniref:Lon proteolytic domain-containing protein n=1 Tax=Paracholeplasma vituli TaxID=69473 RepID=A0ABT2PWP0_9MOLU|nr:S16 family serine protease [Paracholeplasma vituli]MCU0104851.1 hypothetical protein [Paracholeplasma vituli]
MKWLWKHKVTSIVLILVYVSILFSVTYRLNDKTLTLKGDLTPVKTQVNLEQDPHFYTIYVVSMDKPTLFQYWIAKLIKQIDISTLPKAYEGMSVMDQFKMGQIAEELSYQYATIQAYTRANLVNPNIQIDYVLKGYIASFVESYQDDIRLGDILIEVDTMTIDSVSKETLFGQFSNNDQVEVVVLRGQERLTITLNKNTTMDRYGIRFEPYYTLTTIPLLSTAHTSDFVGGPSGGMIQTLDLYMKLLDIDLKELKIAGTGTIELDGTIGAIGGIEQKIYTANDHNIDIFLCGAENYEAALKVYETLKSPTFELIKVGDIDEAIQSVLSRLS